MNWAAIKPAIVSWVRTATGLDAEHVYWTQSGRTRPTGQYVELTVSGVRGVGLDWIDVEDNPTPSAGQEVLYQARGTREVAVQMQCFAGATVGTSLEAATVVEVLERVLAYARLPVVQDALNAAGVALGPYDQVTDATGFPGASLFEPRAVWNLRLHTTSEVSTPDTFIEFVELDADPALPDESVYVPEDPT